jgi:N-acetylmuramoyl-L-alanine amidase CwlA
MYNITDKLIHLNQYTRSGKPLSRVCSLVVHWTGLASGSNNGLFNWFDKVSVETQRYGSAHYGIDKTSIYRFIPDNEIAYHVGASKYTEFAKKKFCDQYPNQYSLGVELNPEFANGEFHEEVLNRAVWLFAELCKIYNLNPMCEIIRHYDVTGKDCPKLFIDHTEKFLLFKEQVKEAM